MNDVPLLVDCDGTLIKTDLLAENFIWVLTHRIGIIPQAIWALFTKGKSSFKRVLARHFDCSQTILPCHQKFLQYLVEQKNLGRKLILCSASDELLLNPLNLNISSRLGMSPQHPLFDACWGSNGKINLAGNQKWERVKREGYLKFDYAGNSWVDVAVWKKAERAIIVGCSRNFGAKVEKKLGRALQQFDNSEESLRVLILIWSRALRVHQWVKNVLLFIPLLLAHNFVSYNWLLTLFAFFAFCLTASSVYILNDLVDLEHDRLHPRKSKRPFACGSLALKQGLFAIPILLLTAGLTVLALPLSFQLVLAFYYLLTVTYSFLFKQVALLDVLSLAGLYTIRIFAGSSVTQIDVSDWLLTFSLFLFVSLAFVKRYAELHLMSQQKTIKMAGRGYSIEDIAPILTQGIASGYLAVLVLSLYLNSDTVIKMYTAPKILWFVIPLLLYWISRVWLLASRGQMHDDPIIFALKDKVSYWVGILIAACAIAAKLGA